METNMNETPRACHSTAPNTPQSGPALPYASHPHLLLVRWEVCRRREDWVAACNTAQALILALPREPLGWLYRSFALQQQGRVAEAQENLLAAARRFPTDWRIAFNLACYACQLGDRAGAWNWLDRAAELGDAENIKRLALEQPVFQPLWQSLGAEPTFPSHVQGQESGRDARP
jgi:tetratricopeptide (TPR) repeat protein